MDPSDGHSNTESLATATTCSSHFDALVEGMALTEKSLLDTFRKHGIEKQHPVSERFDPNLHEAVMQVPDNSVEAGVVVDVFRSGFMIHDRVLRAAQVAVSGANDADEAHDASR